MKVSLPSWIASLSGWNNGLVFYGYKDKYGLCYSRDYVYPTLTVNNTNFGTRGKAVSDTTWKEASLGFITINRCRQANMNDISLLLSDLNVHYGIKRRSFGSAESLRISFIQYLTFSYGTSGGM